MNTVDRIGNELPPQLWFGVSSIFHMLGPSFAVLLFPAVGVLGVAWLRIASAALVFAPITRPLRIVRRLNGNERRLLLAFGGCLAAMNCSFYLALDRLPISLVAAIEFVGTIGVALYGLRTRRNLLALLLVIVGVFILINVKWASEPIGLVWAFLNAVLFVLYIGLGHHIAQTGASNGIERLGVAMMAAFFFVAPIGILQAVRAFSHPLLLLAGLGVGICSSVIPYVCDQLAMARMRRSTFAMFLALLPANATLFGAIILGQIPTVRDLVGIGLVMSGIGLHRPSNAGA